jgi:outer membrane protein TolC
MEAKAAPQDGNLNVFDADGILAKDTKFLNFLTAQRNLYTSEDAPVQSNRAVDTNLIALYMALGGGWKS